MNDTPHTSPFDAIRHEDEQGNEYWSARANWPPFQKIIADYHDALPTHSCYNERVSRGTNPDAGGLLKEGSILILLPCCT